MLRYGISYLLDCVVWKRELISVRINKLLPYQKSDKFIFYGWSKYQPLYNDPIVPWNLNLTNPKGELILNQLEMMPASQALSMSLFSLMLFDGYYLWHDSGPYGNDPNGFSVPEKGTGWGSEWYPADGKTDVLEIAKRKDPKKSGTPGYWDFPTEYYELGNWMAIRTPQLHGQPILEVLEFALLHRFHDILRRDCLLAT